MTNITVLEDTALKYRVEVGTVTYMEHEENSFVRDAAVIQLIDEDVEWEFVTARGVLAEAEEVRDRLQYEYPRVRIVEVTK